MTKTERYATITLSRFVTRVLRFLLLVTPRPLGESRRLHPTHLPIHEVARRVRPRWQLSRLLRGVQVLLDRHEEVVPVPVL